MAGIPSAPVITAATSTESTTATVTFSAPTETGGSDITGHTVASVSGDVTKTATTAGTVTVDGLTPGTDYAFTVTATNAAGFTSDKSAPSGTVTPVKTYAVGDTGPGGGKVFYAATTPFDCGPTLTSTCNYLEVGAKSAATITWCSKTRTLVEGTFGTAAGTGSKNTQNMKNSTTACATGAWVSATAASGGLSDWYLPSKDELDYLYSARTAVGMFEDANSYWSSSQVGGEMARCHQFVRSTGYEGMKADPRYVRPVRAF